MYSLIKRQNKANEDTDAPDADDSAPPQHDEEEVDVDNPGPDIGPSFHDEDEEEETKPEDEEEIFLYFPLHLNHPLLMCEGQNDSALHLASFIERGRAQTPIYLENFRGICRHCNFSRADKGYYVQEAWREVRLFTLSQEAPLIWVVDWWCPQYHAKVGFTGAAHAIIPLRMTITYTAQLCTNFYTFSVDWALPSTLPTTLSTCFLPLLLQTCASMSSFVIGSCTATARLA